MAIKELKLLRIVGLLLLIVALADVVSTSIREYDEQVEQEQRCRQSDANLEPCFGIYDFGRPNYLPFARILCLLVFPFLYWSRKFFWSSIITSMSFLIFGLEFIRGFYAAVIGENYLAKGLTGQLFWIATPLDYLKFLLLALLLVWQISIHFRKARKLI